ncbi:MAG: ABC transporter ATP-binding protein, partial [Deltaproteobacteria bacterium]|nr:ABC transporter ATP-binding protein [Deltaproteobacteria bacterium]
EAQMLAIGRALMTAPALLLLDEATEGLAPLLRREIWRVIDELRQQGLGILMVDKHVGPLLEVAQRHIMLNKGRVVFSGTSAELKSRPELQALHLGV